MCKLKERPDCRSVLWYHPGMRITVRNHGDSKVHSVIGLFSPLLSLGQILCKCKLHRSSDFIAFPCWLTPGGNMGWWRASWSHFKNQRDLSYVPETSFPPPPSSVSSLPPFPRQCWDGCSTTRQPSPSCSPPPPSPPPFPPPPNPLQPPHVKQAGLCVPLSGSFPAAATKAVFIAGLDHIRSQRATAAEQPRAAGAV